MRKHAQCHYDEIAPYLIIVKFSKDKTIIQGSGNGSTKKHTNMGIGMIE